MERQPERDLADRADRRYDPADQDYHPWAIEDRWRQRWETAGTYRTPEPAPGQQTFYCLEFFPYPSGAGLSVGHGRNYVPADVIARYHRMRGEAVLHPMGWDAFGLPAENEAIKSGGHPAETTVRYAAHYRRQLELLGCSYDWAREFTSADPVYYRWNQAFFLRLHRRGLAYRAAAPVNWCAACQTVLADEEIEHGTCWRCHQPVIRRTRPQWFIRTTAYAEALDADLAAVDWPEHIVAMQHHWIGRQTGVEIDLPMVEHDAVIRVFTTRPDTFCGVTFVVLAPEHALAAETATPEQRAAVQAYIRAALQRSDVERHAREPDGVATGARVRLPGDDTAAARTVPVYVADYVLGDYGTGAVMGVPAHDARDFAFARRYGLPVVQVVTPSGGEPANAAPVDLPWEAPGVLVHSGRFDGQTSEAGGAAITAWLTDAGVGRPAVHHRLRDWLVSRQRYWGTPIPIVHCPVCGEVPVPEADLPVVLPPLPDYEPRGDGRSPLANVAAFIQTPCPRCGGPAERETDTMTGFVCSSWYFLRFTDPHAADRPFDPEAVQRWLPVDLYAGGAEHAVSHLLYARFWTKVLADEGLIPFREPFPVLRSQGVLHIRNAAGDPERMSKSKGNVVTPESVIARYGADVTRLHLLFMGPFEAHTVWEVEADGVTPQHIEGARRFLQRVWRLGHAGAAGADGDGPPQENREAAHALTRAGHLATQAVTEQIEALHFNTAVSALMTFAGELSAYADAHGATATFAAERRRLLRLLAPFAPFIAEELWARLSAGDEPDGSIHHAPWPTWDEELVRPQTVELAVQVNGRLRDRVTVAAEAAEAEIRAQALAAPGAARALEGLAVRRVIIVPGRLVNLVAE